MSYWTARSNDYDTVGNHYYEKYSTTEELDFMPRNEIKISLKLAISEIVTTGIVFDAFNYAPSYGRSDQINIYPYGTKKLCQWKTYA